MATEMLKCSECKAAEWCRHTFGKYYDAKSDNGKGCRHPLPQDERTIARHLDAIRKSPTYSPF